MLEPISARELRRLPLRALVAFAARCARRMQPLFDLPEDRPDRIHHLKVIDYAIEVAERFAAADRTVSSACAYSAATDIRPVSSDAAMVNAARIAASSAAAAAYSASTAYSAEGVAMEVVKCALNAANASAVALPASEAARSDLRRLSRLQLGWFPDLGVPVDFSERGLLGPLWPKRMPDWFLSALCNPPKVVSKRIGRPPRTRTLG